MTTSSSQTEICKICGSEFKSRKRLRTHVQTLHSLEFQEYVLNNEHGGVQPSCECGCGNLSPWSQKNLRYSRVFARGHMSEAIKEKLKNSLRQARERPDSKERYRLDAERRRQFFQTDEGQKKKEEIARKCSESNLKVFSSDRGEDIKKRASENRRKFYQSDEGKLVHESARQKLRDFYKTEEGKEVLTRIAERRGKFYQTEEGKLVLEHATELRRLWYQKIGEEEFKRLNKEFWRSEKGRELSKQLALKRKELYASEKGAELRAAHGQKMKDFYQSEEGEAFLQRQSERSKEYWTADRRAEKSRQLKDLYASERGLEIRSRVSAGVSKALKEFYSSDRCAETLRRKRESSKKVNTLPFDEVRRRIEEVAGFELVSPPEEYQSKHSLLSIKCKTCLQLSKRTLTSIEYAPICRECDPMGSKPQAEIYRFIKSLSANVENCARGVIPPLELDLFCPDQKWAFELNGLYWHSEAVRHEDSSEYHDRKTKSCLEKDVRLFHIFEDEWWKKRAIVESMIRVRLGKATQKIHARKCGIRKLSSAQRTEFFETTHIDGDVKSVVAFGLFLGDELVSAISLRKPFHKRYGEHIEIARFSSKLDSVVVGGLSRLMKQVVQWAKENSYKKILSYVDQRHGTGESYIRSGFECRSETAVRFWWTDFSTRINRFQVKASPERDMSERQVAEERGVVRIYGCRSLVLELSC